MRLYHGNDEWFGTQADAKDACGKDFELVEVPTDKPGLIGWLNARERATANRIEISGDCGVAPIISLAKQHATAMRNVDIEEEIGRADFPTACRLAEHILGRLDEHRRSIAAGVAA